MSAPGIKVVSSGKTISEVPHFVNADGQYLYCRYWEPEGAPTCLVFLTHGYGGHSAPLTELALQFTAIGAYVFSHDHIGHGESEGERWYISDYNALARDVLQHIGIVREKHPSLPLFLWGNSLGGSIGLLAALGKQDIFRGVIICGGSMVPDPNTATPFKLFLLRNVGRFFPRLRVMGINTQWFSRDQNELKALEEDPLYINQGMIVRTAQTILDISARIQERMEEMEFPLLIVHGGADKVTSVDGSKMLFEKAKSEDKTLKILPGMYHDMHKDLMEDRIAFFNLITSWVKERLG